MLDNPDALQAILHRFDTLGDRLEAIFGPAPAPSVDYSAAAFRWRNLDGTGVLLPVHKIDAISVAELVGLGHQIEVLDANTRQFVTGLPCNNALLWGARGTGKSSLVKAMLNRYADSGLRLIELDAHDLMENALFCLLMIFHLTPMTPAIVPSRQRLTAQSPSHPIMWLSTQPPIGVICCLS